MTDFYSTDPDDPDAPELLNEYRVPSRDVILRPGMSVLYQNPAWQQPDGTYKTAGMDPPLVVTALFRFPQEMHDEPDYVQAILNNGEWEVNADNLVPDG